MLRYSILVLLLCASISAMAKSSKWENSGPMTSVFFNFQADQSALERTYSFSASSQTQDRFRTFYQNWLDRIEKVDYSELPIGGQADYVILHSRLQSSLVDLQTNKKRLDEATKLIPFLGAIEKIQAERAGRGLIPNGKASGAMLSQLASDIREQTRALRSQLDHPVATDASARRTRNLLFESKSIIQDWHDHFAGYDPLFTWWTERPFQEVIEALDGYIKLVDDELIVNENEGGEIPGEPIGEKALLAELKKEMISYTPAELIEIAKKEMAWVNSEMEKAAKELGYNNWRDALEYVKTLHETPGNQPTLVRSLADEAIAYLEKNDLVTIPDLAKETWRMDMMSPARQLVSPFFLGGETIIVSFPTSSMTHDQKLMSMRGNNRYFSKATVHHELIPGHHLQQFMESRYNTHRQGITNTPFWTEGWALYWEFLLYKRGFAATPEEKIGFLFWRKHRCARIIFSLSFHLGKMTTAECVKMLVDEVGHEQSTAEGEVRRSFNGTYPPLYQAAYMLGAFQLWDIRREMVDSGKMSDKEFHDAILQIGNMPWAIVREVIAGRKIPRDFESDWKFYKGHTQ